MTARNTKTEYLRKDECAPLVKALRERRISLGLKQEAVAQAAGVARDKIGSYERGHTSPRFRNLIKWARALGYEIRFGEVG